MKNNDPYLRSYRILWFAWITAIYLISYFGFFTYSLFVEVDWTFTEPLIAYCLYSIWFNAHNYYHFRKNSLESEKRTNALFVEMEKSLDFTIKEDYPNYVPFDYKQSRKNVFAFSLLAIIINVGLIVMNGGWYLW